MDRADIPELHYITAIANLPSILQHGILSHRRAEQLPHYSVAMPEIQEIRQDKQIPGARNLHEYANLYFDAHNPMLSKRRAHNNEICVLQVAPAVLDVLGVIVTDRNAASGWAGFRPAATGLAILSRERIFARYWTHPGDPYEEMSHKSEKCAEVLVPDSVEAGMIVGAYVANQTALLAFQQLNTELPARIRSDMFF